MRTEVKYILELIRDKTITIDNGTDRILNLFGVSPRIILIQQWEEDPDDKTGWSTWGWEYENGNLFDEVGYELEEVLEEDKYGHITKARFKYVG
jgi:hypothetical protein